MTVVAAIGLITAAMLWSTLAPASCASPRAASSKYRQRTTQVAAHLDASADYPQEHHWTLQAEAAEFTPTGHDVYGRSLRLAPRADAVLKTMVATVHAKRSATSTVAQTIPAQPAAALAVFANPSSHGHP